MDSIYGLNFPIKSFAVANDFVVNTNKACYKLGQALQPFGIYINDTQRENGVLDFSTFNAFVDNQKSLLDEIAEYRQGVFKNFGINVDIRDDIKKRLIFYDYLMTISICYVEIPKWTTKDGNRMATFDKFLCTKNPAIMATWMGDDVGIMQAKYSSRISPRQVEFDVNEIRAVKLMHSSKGNTVTVPRNAFNVEKMTCIPLYMLYAFIQGFKPYIDEGIVNFSFLKDNGTIRELATTLNQSILMDYYKDNIFVGTMLSGVDIDAVQQGGMNLGSKMNRGYIKVPELGASRYDGTGCRSLNVARLLKAERVDSVDRSFIDVDLNSVVQNFKDAIDYALKKVPDEIPNIYKAITGEDADTTQQMVLVGKLYDYADSRSMLLSTTFHRALHKFMISNPIWFPLYTGMPNGAVVSSATNVGVVPLDDF